MPGIESMNFHRLSSEYNRSYKPKAFICASGMYDKNVDYRLQRREAEQFHHVDPFVWDDEDSSTDSDENCVGRRTPKFLVHRYKHEKLNEAYRLMHTEPGPQREFVQPAKPRPRTAEARGSYEPLGLELSRAVQTPDLADVAVSTDDTGRIAEEKGCQVSKSVSSLRDKSTQKSLPAFATTTPKPPFIAYGFLDQHKDTGMQQTHNIRAATSVYPSAQRAMKRKQIEAEHKQRQRMKSSHQRRGRTSRTPDLMRQFNRKMDEDTACWQTEYGSHYRRYDNAEYRRSDTPRVTAHRTPAEFYIPW